ncbi:MAG: di-heme-cytochrome C peroxidase, partial [Pirellulaceae bacterium]|nr:di-heme-cytochrome C peroxidase [Pirellulaceae bacterium]
LAQPRLSISALLTRICFFNILMFATLAAHGQQQYAYQGEQWTSHNRQQYYTVDQGSRIMPTAWAKALREPSGRLFWRDSGSRYGFIPHWDESFDNQGFPVGFFVVADKKKSSLSMNCAACHTRQISAEGVEYRIDGGPALADYDTFFRDLFVSVEFTLSNKPAFRKFQRAVRTPAKKLKRELNKWYALNQLTMGQLPERPWGVGRIDALSTIMNRVTGAFIGQPPSFLIPENVATAENPVRFPFLWNVEKQDLTQWSASAVNGNSDYALKRNAAEVQGVFGMLHIRGNNFLVDNSIDYKGLKKLNKIVKDIGAPLFPKGVDFDKAARGWVHYENNCANCHGISPGDSRPPDFDTWYTPLPDVGTDRKYWVNLDRTSPSSGLLTGRTIEGVNVDETTGEPMPIPATGVKTLELTTAVNLSALRQKYPKIDLSIPYPESTRPREVGGQPAYAYEAKVLEGAWAAAPFLHNGSVASLAELLKPAADRKKMFLVGPSYDLENLGLAEDQPTGTTSLFIVIDDLFSGDSNQGHEYGVDLTDEQKSDLLEYLKCL